MKTLSKVYCFLAGLHRALYRAQVLKKYKSRKKVISVGNISFGGTGKTPFVLSLVEELQSLGFRPGIVCRSYRGELRGPCLMDLEKAKSPEVYGDEPSFYVLKTHVPVVTGPRKWQAARILEEMPEVDLIVVDDGFQHYKLHRDLDIVLLDASRGIQGFGVLRESPQALREAQVLVLTKSQGIADQEIERIKKFLPPDRPLFFAETKVAGIWGLLDHREKKLHGPVGLVSGLAEPRFFEKIFRSVAPDVQIKRLDFEDHHEFSDEDMRTIESWSRKENLKQIVVTEKDEVKLKKLALKAASMSWNNWFVLRIQNQMKNSDQWTEFLKGILK